MAFVATLLVVDDDEVLGHAMRRLLARMSVTVLTAASVDDARQVLDRTASIDAVFLDLQLGEESGLTLLPDVRAAHPLASCVLFTGAPSDELTAEAIALGVHDFLLKSASTGEIRLACARALERTQLLREREQLVKRERELAAELAAAHEEWQRTCDALSKPVVLVDHDDIVQRSNKAAQRQGATLGARLDAQARANEWLVVAR